MPMVSLPPMALGSDHGDLTNRVTTSFRLVGIPPTHLHLSSGRHLLPTIMPKFSTQKLRIWAMILKHFRKSSPNGR
jgi:hypothetical protein